MNLGSEVHNNEVIVIRDYDAGGNIFLEAKPEEILKIGEFMVRVAEAELDKTYYAYCEECGCELISHGDRQMVESEKEKHEREEGHPVFVEASS